MLTISKETAQPGQAISASPAGDILTNRRPVTTIKRIVRTAFIACIGAVLVACGGGNDGDGGGGGGIPPPTGVAVNQGVVTGLGSVFVNGIEFSTTGATFTIDDNPGNESQLKVGMVVKVTGTSNDATRTGTATKVEARDILEGPISSVDPVNKTVTVMGRTVRIEDNVTRLNDDDLQKVFADAQFVAGNHVEVHGFADDQGGVRATRVLRKAAGEFESKGFVTALGANSFVLSLTKNGTTGVTVNFVAGALPAGGIANGNFVEVKSAVGPVGTVLTATLIKLENKLGAGGDKAEVEGIVTSGTSASFVVNGQTVVTNTSTVFESGLSTDVVPGARLEAEGLLDNNGVIVATKVSFHSNVRIEADATAVTATSISVLGKTVAINNLTRIDTPVLSGNHVEIRAIADRNGDVVATRIDVKGASTKAFLQGPVTAADSVAGTLTILGPTATSTNTGVTVVSDGETEWKLSNNANEVATTKAAFFAQIVNTVTVVKVKWDPFINLAGAIKEAEIEKNAPPPTTTTTTSGATTSTTATTATSTSTTGITGTSTSTTATTATSTSTTATTVTTTTSTTLPLPGVARFNALCSGCHGPIANTPKRGATAVRIQTAINNNVGGMGFLSILTPAEVAEIAAALL